MYFSLFDLATRRRGSDDTPENVSYDYRFPVLISAVIIEQAEVSRTREKSGSSSSNLTFLEMESCFVGRKLRFLEKREGVGGKGGGGFDSLFSGREIIRVSGVKSILSEESYRLDLSRRANFYCSALGI